MVSVDNIVDNISVDIGDVDIGIMVVGIVDENPDAVVVNVSKANEISKSSIGGKMVGDG